MSYEILYKRFLLKKNNKLIPYVINGSNNCFELSGKRERNTTNLFECYKEDKEKPLNELLSIVFKEISHENSGFLKGVPKTEKAFIKGFYDKVINEDDFNLNGVYMEETLNRLFKTTKKIKSDFEILKEIENKPFIELNEETIKQYQNKSVLPFNRFNKLIIGKGKIKSLFGGGFGFFKSRSKRRYYYLSEIKYIKVI